MTPAMTRETVTIDRAMEFFREDELAKQIGFSRPWWAAAILKEVIDNGLDAAEDAGRPPEVEVRIGSDGFTVADNGPGIRPEVVAGSLDFTTRTTDKALYVAPTRGRQGNAMKTIWAAPFVVSGGTGEVTIEACGVRHDVAVTTDRLNGTPNVDRAESPSAVKPGSVFAVRWPSVASCLTPARPDDLYDAGSDSCFGLNRGEQLAK